jgi:hypothetical protein
MVPVVPFILKLQQAIGIVGAGLSTARAIADAVTAGRVAVPDLATAAPMTPEAVYEACARAEVALDTAALHATERITARAGALPAGTVTPTPTLTPAEGARLAAEGEGAEAPADEPRRPARDPRRR